MKNFKFIDLFCGIGGFHLAMNELGGECVFAAEIDKSCVSVYEDNFNMDPYHDMTEISVDQIPFHDVLCAGFPCQAFSKAGKQEGTNDPRGNLFFEISRILRHHHPKFIILENVRNLVNHNNGKTWEIITKTLRGIGYRLSEKPIILSPHQFGVPQFRERVYIIGKYEPDKVNYPLVIDFKNLKNKSDCSIDDIIQHDEVRNKNLIISEHENNILMAWDEFYQGIRPKVLGFPINISFFKSNYEIMNAPKWLQSQIVKNKKLYLENKSFIDSWLVKWNYLKDFTPSQRKFEWQAGTKIRSIYEGIIQFRPSGIRVKCPDVFPTLVACVQIPIIGKLKRRLTLRECARLQSFPDSFITCQNRQQAYKQFGNSINVKVVVEIGKRLFNL